MRGRRGDRNRKIFLDQHIPYEALPHVLINYSREVIAWQIGFHHTTRLVLDVLDEAIKKRLIREVNTPHMRVFSGLWIIKFPD